MKRGETYRNDLGERFYIVYEDHHYVRAVDLDGKIWEWRREQVDHWELAEAEARTAWDRLVEGE